MMLFKKLREEIDSIRSRDPAARSVAEILLCYPGLHALIFYRCAHWAWERGWHLAGRFLSHLGKLLTGIEIHPGARIGERLFIDHGTGVVIGETAILGNDVTIYQGVTLGGTSLNKGKRHPTLEDGVIVGSGAQVLGPITIGSGARIGANAVVISDVPSDVTMVGIPARAVLRKGSEKEFLAYGVDATLPDPVARAMDGLRREMAQLLDRVAELEAERDRLRDMLRETACGETAGEEGRKDKGLNGSNGSHHPLAARLGPDPASLAAIEAPLADPSPDAVPRGPAS